MRVREYGLEWDLDPDQKKGQLGLLHEDHYKMLFAPGQREKSLRPTDRWLDIGANIGAFALRAAPFVEVVVAVEPEPNNFYQLEMNAIINDITNITFIKAAVVGGKQRTVPLALSNSYTSTHKIGHVRGRQSIDVNAFNIDDLVRTHETNKLKIDCEGTEGEILKAVDLKPIDEVVFEYHFSYLKDEDWSGFYAILERLKKAGLKILKQPKEKSSTWHTIVWASR